MIKQPLCLNTHPCDSHRPEDKPKRAISLETRSPGGVGEQLGVFAPREGGLWSRFGSTFDHHPAVFSCQDSLHWVVLKRGSTGCGGRVWIIHHKLRSCIH